MKMKNPLKDHVYHHRPHSSLVMKLLQYALYALLPIALFRFWFHPSPPPSPPDSLSFSSSRDDNIELPSISLSYSSLRSPLPPPSPSLPPPPPSPPPPPISQAEEDELNEIPTTTTPRTTTTTTKTQTATTCDYTNGGWVPSKAGPLYNGTNCGTIKDGQNCMSHGRPDLGYLYWRWKPRDCSLPRFDPSSFLDLLRDKHLAFVGDSMARNQLESLICLLSSSYPQKLIYSHGDEIKFRRWHFPSHNVNISGYWSPFLVKGIEKSNSGPVYNKLFLHAVDEKWASDLREIDMVVLSIGHWFLHPAVYFEGEAVLGCHSCDGFNHTEIGFYSVFRKAHRTALKAIVDRKSASDDGRAIDAIVTTFMPSHFEGDWDKAGTCSKTKPYKEGEIEVEGMNAEMRRIALEEVEEAKMKIERESSGEKGIIRVNALDVTKISLLRPDGHPGPYMHPFPFANGFRERVPNDCLHFCLPGPVDTWNEIMLEVIMKQSHQQSSSGK